MNQVWTSFEKGEDKIIGIGNGHIYKINPKNDKISGYAEMIRQNNIANEILTIPFSYITTIQYQEGKNFIQIFFGKESEEHLRIPNEDKRKEVLKYFKDNISNIEYRFEKYSAFKSARKSLIALLIVSLIFAWTLYLAIQIELGYDYELIGSGRSITAIVLGLAYLGVFKVVLIFGSLISVALFSTIRKMRNRPSVHELVIIR